jgi:hypothetical protein
MSERGAQQLAQLSRQLRAAGDRELQKELTRSITEALKPLRKEKLPQSATDHLPRRGGLNKRIAKSKYTISRRTSNRTQGLRLNAKYMYNLMLIDKGFVRHPAFKRRGEEGRRVVWVTQRVEPGWFTKPMEDAQPDVQRRINEAMQEIADRITEGL